MISPCGYTEMESPSISNNTRVITVAIKNLNISYPSIGRDTLRKNVPFFLRYGKQYD